MLHQFSLSYVASVYLKSSILPIPSCQRRIDLPQTLTSPPPHGIMWTYQCGQRIPILTVYSCANLWSLSNPIIRCLSPRSCHYSLYIVLFDSCQRYNGNMMPRANIFGTKLLCDYTHTHTLYVKTLHCKWTFQYTARIFNNNNLSK